ncbi:unnamed protein product [Prorocentrum cordatum]|uniref:Uncharacterized protein n=1 Tax=Prorocentrum cordatum TaxID=2364126 RepID=A0ABN9WBG6_9DINO|nr:unnamed protein product [Polarella glacialis]
MGGIVAKRKRGNDDRDWEDIPLERFDEESDEDAEFDAAIKKAAKEHGLAQDDPNEDFFDRGETFNDVLRSGYAKRSEAKDRWAATILKEKQEPDHAAIAEALRAKLEGGVAVTQEMKSGFGPGGIHEHGW